MDKVKKYAYNTLVVLQWMMCIVYATICLALQVGLVLALSIAKRKTTKELFNTLDEATNITPTLKQFSNPAILKEYFK